MRKCLLAMLVTLGIAACDSSEPLIVDEAHIQKLEEEALEPPVIGAATGNPSDVGQWGPVMDWPHVAVSMATLPDGRLLTYSGSERRTWPTTEQTYSAVWDPETGIFEENLHRGHNMFCAAMSMTEDGKVFVNGGRNQGNSPWTTLFDYNNNEWQTIENMASGGRWYPTTLATGNGAVMTALGVSTNTRNPDYWRKDEGWRVLNGVDFLNMRTRNNSLGRENVFPLLSVAPNGNIFHYWDTVENHMINPVGNGDAVRQTAQTDGDNHAGGVQVMYDVGKLLVTGRNDGSWGGNATGASDDAFTIDLNGAGPDIRATTKMSHRRKYHQFVPLPTGEMLVVGGNTTGVKFRDSGSVMEPEVWNPQTGEWRGMANMSVPRDYHSTAMLLTDGRVITAGGGYDAGNPNSSGTHQDAQIFSPPYLFAGNGSAANRPTVTASQASVDSGDTVSVTTTGNISYFSMIRMSATTHSINTDVRFYKPEFQSTGNNSFDVTVHANPNVSIPGYWMLFAVNNAGVPSEAQVLRITALDTRLENLAPTGVATQSSNSQSALAERAIDENITGSEQGASLAQTTQDPEAWWELDLGRVVDVDTIRLWNRLDATSLSNFHVLVSNEPFNSQDLAATIAQPGVIDFHTAGTAGRQTDINVSAQGRYLRVQLAGNAALELAEVQVFGAKRSDLVNLAPTGVASQSSQYRNTGFNASIAIDGVTSANTDSGKITHTSESERDPWWELDLGRVVDIDSLAIWNRTNCCSERLSDFRVFVSDVEFDSQNLDTTTTQPGVMTKVYATADTTTEVVVGRTGRYVRIQLRTGTTFRPLHMIEVQVFGTEVDEELVVQPITGSPTASGSQLSLTANATGSGQLQYSWNFGDGPDTAFSNNPSINHTYTTPGRYVVSLTVRDQNGEVIRSTFNQIVHAAGIDSAAVSSGGLLAHSNTTQVWNVNPDNNSVSVIDTQSLSLAAEIPVGLEPVSIAEAPNGDVWVVNRGGASISVIDNSSLAVSQTISLDRATQPYGIVFNDSTAFVALQAVGEVQKVALNGTPGTKQSVGTNPRHLALDASGDVLYVSRYITQPLPGEESAIPVTDDGTNYFGGEVLVLNASTLATDDIIVLEHINRIASEHEGPGVPNYLGPVVISPDGSLGWVPSKQDNILGGDLRGGDGITFDQTVRAVTSVLDLGGNEEVLPLRVDHDNASVAASATFDPFGATLFVSLEGNRQISLIDAATAIEIGRFDTGRAPQSLRVSANGKQLYVHNFMDRTVSIFDVEDIVMQGTTASSEIATINVVSSEVLDATVLRGKQLFYDARDDRLAALDYMSCASCHVDGEHDGRTWDFTGLGEGLRNTITLKGRAGTGHGKLHWSSNFDEIQDFENQIREFAGGTGLMSDEDFAATRPLFGQPKAGLSGDLDALTAYMESLTQVDESPWKNADGTLTASALNGQSLFVANGCDTCHTGAIYTDSNTSALHDIGSLSSSSGTRVGLPLGGLDTPTLLGAWRTAPYLHDGSAATIEDAIASHISVSLSAADQTDIANFVRQLDQGVPFVPPVNPPVNPPAAANPGVSNPMGAQTVVIDGTLSEWNGLVSYGSDPDDAGGVNTIDWNDATIAHDDSNFYIAYRNRGAITESWGYGIYIDVDDSDLTGFKGFSSELPIGADYLIEGRVVLRYTGSGTNWSWVETLNTPFAINGNTAELSVDRSVLGDAQTLKLYFKGSNEAVGGDVVDYYPDAVIDPTQDIADRIFTYTIANSTGNAPPTALAQSVSVSQNSQVAVLLQGRDLNGDALTFEVVDEPTNGTLSGTPPNLLYRPTQGFLGTDTFAFTAADAQATSAAATIEIVTVGETPNNDAVNVNVDGSLAEWSSVTSFGIDPEDATASGDQIDWQEAWMAHDADNLYVAFTNRNPVTLSWGYGIYIDIDNNANTGFKNFDGSYPIGVDYLIEADELQRYTGDGTNWSWDAAATLDMQFSGNSAEVAVPRNVLGDLSNVRVFFVGENAAFNGPTLDYYPNGATDTAAAIRYFTYDVVDSNQQAAPVAIPQILQVQQDTTLDILLSGTDVNGDTLTYQITRQPSNGTLFGSDVVYTYLPDRGFIGAESFEFRVNDGNTFSDPVPVSITVNGNGFTPGGSNPVDSISVDGSLQDWSGVTPLAAESSDNSVGNPDAIDWLQGYIAHSDTMLYLAVQNQNTIDRLTWGYAVYLDTDGSTSTGFTGYSSELSTGADFLIEGSDLYRYSGSGNNWLWTYVATIDAQPAGSVIEYAVPRSMLGDPTSIEVFFRGDNESIGGEGIDFYPNTVTDPTTTEPRSFSYELAQ